MIIVSIGDSCMKCLGVVGWCEGVMYLMSPGRPTDIGLQLGKACYPLSSLFLSFISSTISSITLLPFSGR